MAQPRRSPCAPPTRAHCRDARVRGVRAGARRDRTANGLPPTTSPRSSSGSGPGRCRAATCSVPFEFTAGSRDGGSSRVGGRADRAFDGAAATCRRCRSPTMAGDRRGRVCRLRHRGARVAELRLRQLRRARREGQGRRRPALFPRGCRRSRRAASSRAIPTCATRPWPRGSAAPRRCSSSPDRVRPMRASSSR